MLQAQAMPRQLAAVILTLSVSAVAMLVSILMIVLMVLVLQCPIHVALARFLRGSLLVLTRHASLTTEWF